MEAALAEATARTQKAEREYAVLRDSLKGLVAGFQADTDALREEMRKREEKVLKEAEEMGRRYTRLVEEVRREREDGSSVVGEARRLREENERIRKEVEESFRDDIAQLRAEVDRQGKESETAWKTAKCVAWFVPATDGMLTIVFPPTETLQRNSRGCGDLCAPTRQQNKKVLPCHHEAVPSFRPSYPMHSIHIANPAPYMLEYLVYTRSTCYRRIYGHRTH